MKNWLKLIAEKRQINAAKTAFMEGTTLKNTKKHVQGSNATFQNYLRACKESGFNPVTIPRDWKSSYIKNPISELLHENEDPETAAILPL